MREYIKKLQSKTEETRKHILVWLLVACMSIVCLIWVVSLSYKFHKETTPVVENTAKPFSLLSKTISDTYKNATASVGRISFSGKKVETQTPDKVIDLILVEKPNQ